jgi:predicted ATPase
VAYGGLLQERRRALHVRIMEAMEQEHTGRLEEYVEQLGQHAYRGEAWDKAVTYLQQAGAKAVARSANREALPLFEQALAALAHLPQGPDTLSRELDLRIASCAPLISVEGGSAPAVEEAYGKARVLCERLDDTSRLFPVLWGSWYARFSRGETDTARETGERLFALAQQSGDPAVLLEAHHTMWTTLSQAGDWLAAREHLERGFALYDRRQHRTLAHVYGAHDPGVCCKNFLGSGMWAAGYPEQGLAHVLEGVGLARETSHGANLTTVIALHHAALIHYLRGEFEAGIPHAQGVLELADPRTQRSYATDASIILARLTVDRPGGLERVGRLASALPSDRLRGAYWRDIVCLLLLAEAFGEAGRPHEGLALLRLPVENEFSGYMAPEVYRLYGVLGLQAGGPQGEARHWLRQAKEMALARQQRSFELRAALDLARLLAASGERARAEEELRPVFERFSEGVQTRDLMQAKEQLDAL